MQSPIIYHNPQCSKSRATLDLLQKKGLNPVVVEYLKTPLDYNQLKALSAHFPLNEFVRTDEAIFRELHLSLDDKNAVLEAMVNYPKLMQRPIVSYNEKAAIGRPPENVLKLFDMRALQLPKKSEYSESDDHEKNHHTPGSRF